MEYKICTKCKKELPSTAEYFHRGVGKYGFRAVCKKCLSGYFSEYYQKNRKKKLEYKRNYYKDNQSTILEKEKIYRENNKEIVAERRKRNNKDREKDKLTQARYREKNRTKIRARARQYYRDNKDKVMAYQREYLKNNIHARIAARLRQRVNKAIRNNKRPGSAVKDLGCTLCGLKIHLESKFSDGMSWENYGEWHVDHIIALAHFDLTDRNQFLEACHYTNLQPLWAKDNIRKYIGTEMRRC
jgi:hypothetical protein